jgi:hypothetical protein
MSGAVAPGRSGGAGRRHSAAGSATRSSPRCAHSDVVVELGATIERVVVEVRALREQRRLAASYPKASCAASLRSSAF